MTKDYVQQNLTSINETFDAWTTLYKKVGKIVMVGDTSAYIDPTTRIFYFSSDGYLVIKNLSGTLYKTDENASVPDNCVKILIDNVYYLVPIANYGIMTTNQDLGKIHLLIDYDNICEFDFVR